MQTIKLIDLYVKIANGKEMPKKIKLEDKLYIFEGKCGKYYRFDLPSESIEDEYYISNILNEEVEIIEDIPKENKKIKKLNLDTDKLKGKEIPRAIDYLLEDKINKIIDKVNVEENESEEIIENKKIEKFYFSVFDYGRSEKSTLEKIENKLNEIIDKINGGEENESN